MSIASIVQRAKAYLVNGTERIRIFGDKSLRESIASAIESVRVDNALDCLELSVHSLRKVLEENPDVLITPNLQGFIDSFHPELFKPVDLPSDDYWQSLLPPHFTLRPFQIEFLNWAESRRLRAYPPKGSQTGVICSLDQGLGKTPVAIAWDQHLREKDIVESTFVVCRNNNKHSTWVRHFDDLTDLNMNVIEGTRAKRLILFEDFNRGDFDVAIINYETFRLHKDELKRIGHLILDEAHKVANPKSKQSIVSNNASKKAPWTTELTGGAAQNRIETQLWHPLHIVDPTVWSSYNRWKKTYCILKTIKVPLYRKGKKIINPKTRAPVLREITVVNGIKNREQLSAAIAPFIYQKKKDEVGEQLPPKIFQVIDTYLTKEQRRLYIEVRDDLRTQINGVTIPIALTKMLRLYQLCATLEYFDLGDISKKADEASEVMYDIVPNGHKALVFTQHVLLAHAIYRRLTKLGSKALLLTGQSPRSSKAKDEVRDTFKVSDHQFLVTMIQMEGEGSDYPEADHVFRLDRDHRPLVNIQCEDRAHRLTSTRPVNIIDFVTKNSIEETQVEILEGKMQNLSGVFNLAKAYTIADIRRLLEMTPKST